jgi:hypothetical protein
LEKNKNANFLNQKSKKQKFLPYFFKYKRQTQKNYNEAAKIEKKFFLALKIFLLSQKFIKTYLVFQSSANELPDFNVLEQPSTVTY